MISETIAGYIKPYLKEYFRNFDENSLSFSLWHASAEMNDLQFRPNVLERAGLDLPFQAKVIGSIGKVYISLGLSHCDVTINDVCILVATLERLTYEEKQELAAEIERKRKELEELMKKSIASEEKKIEEEEGPGWAARKALSYAQGTTVNIENIHIRFEEDCKENELKGNSPFAAGLQLRKFTVENIDEITDWTKGVTLGDDTFFKKADLQGLSAYWNSSTPVDELIGKTFNGESEATVESSIKEIAVKLKDYLLDDKTTKTYILKPIAASAKTMITKNPEKLENKFGLPKVHADLEMETITVDFNDLQYEAILSYQDYVNQLSRGRKWLKYRPVEPIKGKGNAKKWWIFAYKTVQGDVERRRKNWSWEHIKQHRANCNNYAALYFKKLTEETPSEELLKELQVAEDLIDNFNVLLLQKETEKKNNLRKELYQQKKEEADKQRSWYSFGSSTVTMTQEEVDEYIKEHFKNEDKKKIYSMIDFDPTEGKIKEPEGNVDYPKDFSEFVVNLNLKGLQANLKKFRNENNPLNILHAELNTFSVGAETKPGVAGLKITASINNLEATGIGAEGSAAPEIFKSIKTEDSPANFLEAGYYANAPDSKADQKVTLHSQQSQLTYDYYTVQKLMDLFAPPPNKIQQVGGPSKWTGFSRMSGDGLQNLSKTSSTFEIDISLAAPNVVVPQNGVFSKNSDNLIVHLGTLSLQSSPRDKADFDTKALDSVDPENISPEILKAMFNHFEIKLSNFEILLALQGEDVYSILYEKGSKKPKPLGETEEIAVNVYQCIATEDVRFPKLKANASIPLIAFDLVDTNILRLAHLGLTLPLPKPAEDATKTADKKQEGALVFDADEDATTNYKNAIQNVSDVEIAVAKKDKPTQAQQFTNLIAGINFGDLKILVSVQEGNSAPKPFLEYNLHNLYVNAKLKSFSMSVDAGISYMHAEYSGAKVPGITGPVYLLYTPLTESQTDRALKCHLSSVTSDCPPELAGNIKQEITLDVSSVDFILHQESITSFVSILFRLKDEISSMAPKTEVTETKVEEPTKTEENVDFEDVAKQSKINAEIVNFEVLNLENNTQFPKILSVEGDSKLISVDVAIHKKVDNNSADPELELKATIGGPKLIVVGSYVKNIKKFVDNFQEAFATMASYSKDAGSQAVDMGSNLYQNDKKILLDLNINSPQIILAKSDGSLEVLYYYFGNVKLKNNLKVAEKALDKNAVLDEMSLDVGGMKLTRAIIDANSKNPTVESNILQPIQIQLNVVRNLSKAWYLNAPGIKATASLSATVLTLSDDDAMFAISCYLDLIGKVFKKSKRQVEEVTDAAGSASASDTSSSLQSFKPVAGLAVQNPADTAVMVDFGVTINEIGISLYQGILPLTGKQGTVERDASHAFGGISVKGLSASGNILNNNNLNVKLGLSEIQVQDKRQDAFAIRDLMVYDAGSGGSAKQLLDVNVKIEKISGSEDKLYTVFLETRSLTMIFNMNFINSFIGYVLNITNQIPAAMKSAFEDPEEHDIEEIVPKEEEKPSEPSKPPFVNANVNLNELTIIVLQNPKSADTNAVQLAASGKVNVETHNGVTEGQAALQLSSYSSKFDMHAPSVRLSEILRPMTLTADIVFEPKVKTTVDAVVSDVLVHISAGTLHLITKIATELGDTFKSKSVKEVKEEEDYTHVWQPKGLGRSKLWFLNTTEIVGGVRSLRMAKSAHIDPIEKVTLKTGKLFVTLESGVGAMTTPLIFIDTSVNAEVGNWTKQLHVFGSLKLACGYNNTYVGEMEYIIEPNEVPNPLGVGNPVFAPMELKFDVEKAKSESSDQKQNKFVVNISTEKSIELMISKSGIEIIKTVAESFGNASSTETKALSESNLESAPYVFKNSCTADMILNVDGTSLLRFVNGVVTPGDISVNQGQTVQLGVKSKILGSDDASGSDSKRLIRISIPNYNNFSAEVRVDQPRARFFKVNAVTIGGAYCGLLVDIEVAPDYSTHITVRTAVQIVNELERAVDVYEDIGLGYQKKLSMVGTVQSRGTFCLPFNSIYDKNKGLQFKPKGYAFGRATFVWQGLNQTRLMPEATTREVDGVPNSFNFNIIGTPLEAVNGNTEQSVPGGNFIIRLKPLIAVRNLLPFPIEVISSGSYNSLPEIVPVDGGREKLITTIPATSSAPETFGLTIKIPKFDGHDWHTSFSVIGEEHEGEQSAGFAGFTSYETTKKAYFKIEKIMENHVAKILVYATHWIVNYTGMDIFFKASTSSSLTYHPSYLHEPQVLPIESGSETEKPRLMVMVQDGTFSLPAIIDDAAVGLPSGVTCSAGSENYEFSLSVELGKNQRTKIVYIKPRFTITNNCSFGIVFNEVLKSDKVTIPPNKVVPYWPKSDVGYLRANLSVEGTFDITPLVNINETNQQFLKLDNKHGGLCYSVSVHESKTSIVVNEFAVEEIPLLFVNNTPNVRLQIKEDKEDSNPMVLEPKSSLYHSWSDVLIENKGVYWNVVPNGQQFFSDLTNPLTTTFQANGTQYKCIAFTSGLRKILLFTTFDDNIENIKSKREAFEAMATLEVNLTLQGIGISVIDNINSKDVLYGKIAGSESIIWESAEFIGSADLFLPFDDHKSHLIEGGYQFYLAHHAGQSVALNIGEGFVVDYSTLLMQQPSFKSLKRGGQKPGLGLIFRKYPLGIEAEVELNTIRVDCQLDNATYAHVLAPTKNEDGTKNSLPFLILKFKKMSSSPKSNVSTINGTVALQPLTLNADMLVIGAILELAGGHIKPKETAFVDFSALLNDIDYITKVLEYEEFYISQLEGVQGENPIWIFNDFQIYQIMLTISFSMTGIDELKNKLSESSFVNHLLGMLGTFKIGISDAVLEIEGIHYEYFRTTPKEIMALLQDHYVASAKRNLLGNLGNLDFPGNPFGVVKGLGKGTKAILGGLSKGDIGGTVKGVGTLIGGTVSGITDFAGGILGGLGHATDQLKIPILGDLFGGAGKVVTGTGQAFTGTGNASAEVTDRIRPPRKLQSGFPIKPFSSQDLAAGRLLSLMRNDPHFQASGSVITQVPFGYQVAIVMERKLFILDMPDHINITNKAFYEWRDITNVTTDGRNTIYLTIQSQDRWKRASQSNVAIVTDSSATREFLTQKIQQQVQQQQQQQQQQPYQYQRGQRLW